MEANHKKSFLISPWPGETRKEALVNLFQNEFKTEVVAIPVGAQCFGERPLHTGGEPGTPDSFRAENPKWVPGPRVYVE